MESLQKRSANADLEQLVEELSARARGNKRRSIRIKVWRFTVFATYSAKRLMDIVGSIAGLVLLSPVFAAIAVAVKLSSPGPVIFAQTRVGRYGRHFKFFKFRSMRTDAEDQKDRLLAQNESSDGVIFKMKNDPRITRCGRFIRKYSIDEAPQFINVLLGDMSLVGPRPPLPYEVAQYTLDDRKRLEILPGITCIWQISGRSDIPFREQVVLDKEYIRGQGFWKDVLILFKTIPAVIAGKGAY